MHYLLNGLVATFVHYGALYIAIDMFNFESAGLSNFLASIVGITCTFFGNRYFVFQRNEFPILKQAFKFIGFYLTIAFINGGILFLWTDYLGHSYKIGFLFCLCLQISIGYFLAKNYVFHNKAKLTIKNLIKNTNRKNSSFSYSGNELQDFSDAINWKAYWLNEILPFLGDEVLEIGAGIGSTVKNLNFKKFRKWFAFEPDKSMYWTLKKINSDGKFGKGFKVVNGTSANLQNRDTFDTILYIDVLEHIEHDYQELAHVQNYLVEGGHIIIVAPAHNFLFTSFDKKIGHYRRYNKKMLRSLVPKNMIIKKIRYLDSVGLIASLANKIFLRTDSPSYNQIQIWDNFMVKHSRWLDIMIGHLVGKSIVCILEKK